MSDGYSCPNGHVFPSPVAVRCDECEASVACVPSAQLFRERDIAARTWVDIRVLREDVPAAVALIGAARKGCVMHIDTNPPSAAPGIEWELSVNVGGEAFFSRMLRRDGITVLAIRTRI